MIRNLLIAAALLTLAPLAAWGQGSPTQITFACGASSSIVGPVGTATPPLTVVSGQTGASKTFGTAAANCGTAQIRSNSGTAMTDTLVAPATLGANWYFYIANADATATDTITIASGTITGPSGAASTLVVQPGESGVIATDGTNAFVVSGTLGAARASFNPASPGPIGGTTPGTAAFTTIAGGAVTPSVVSVPFVFSQNVASALVNPFASTVQISAADNTVSRLTLAGFGSTTGGSLILAGSGGTGAAPTATPSGKMTGSFGFGGFDGTSWAGGSGMFSAAAINTWTPSDHGSNAMLGTIAAGTTAQTTLIEMDGSLVAVAVGGATGAESLNVPNVASAVNRVKISGATTTNGPILATAGSDTNVPLNITPQGTGTTNITKNGLTISGELTSTQATLPTVASCGTGSPAVTANSSDLRGSVTTGTAATSCAITFKGSPAFATAPFCTVSGSSIVSFPAITAVSATTLTLGISAAVTGDVLTWHCIQ